MIYKTLYNAALAWLSGWAASRRERKRAERIVYVWGREAWEEDRKGFKAGMARYKAEASMTRPERR